MGSIPTEVKRIFTLPGVVPMKIKCLAFNIFKKEYKLFLLESQACWITLINYLALFI